MEIKKYQQYVFRKEWREEFKWLSESDDVSRAYCKICSSSILISNNGRHAILAHEAAKKHRKKMEEIYHNLKQIQDIKSQRSVLECNQITQYPLQSSTLSTPAIPNYTTEDTRISKVPELEYNRTNEFRLQSSIPSTTAISNYATQNIRISKVPKLEYNRTTESLLRSSTRSTTATSNYTTQDISISKVPMLEYNRTTEFLLQSFTPSTTASSNCTGQVIEKSNAPALEFNQTAQFSSQTSSPIGTVALDDTENKLLIAKQHNSPSLPIMSTLCETIEEIALYNKKENISQKKPIEKKNSTSNNSGINITNVYSGVDVENINEKSIIKEKRPNTDMNSTTGETTVYHKKEKINLENLLESNNSTTCDSNIKTANICSMDSKAKTSNKILRISPKDCMENSSREKHEKSIYKTHQNLENCLSDNTLLVTEKPLHGKSLEIQDGKTGLHSQIFHSVSNNETPTKITPKEIILKYNNGGKCSENAQNEEIQAFATKVKSSRTNNSISENSPKNIVSREIKSTTESSNPKKFQAERIEKLSNSSKCLKGKKKVVISHTSDSLNEDISKLKLNTSDDIQFPEDISSNDFLDQNISIQDVSNSIQQNTQPPESSLQHAVLIPLPGTKRTYNHFLTESAVNTIVQESSKTEPESIKNIDENLNQIQSNPLSEQFSSDFFSGAHESHKLIKSTKRNNNKNSKANELTKHYVPIEEVSDENAYLEHLSGLHDCFMTSIHSQMNAYLLKKRRLRESLKKSISKRCSQKVLMKTIIRKYKLLKTRPLQNTSHENWRKKYNGRKNFKKDNTHSSVNFSQTETNISTHNAITSLQKCDNFIHSSISVSSDNVSVGVEHDSSNDIIDNEAFTLASDSLSKGPHSSTLLPNNVITTERKTCNLISSIKHENLKKSLSQSSIISNSLASSQIFDSNERDVKFHTGNCIASCSSAEPDHNPCAATSGVLSRLPSTFCKDSSSFTSTNNYPFPSHKSIFNSRCFEKIRNLSTRLLERNREFEITCARDLNELQTLIANVKLHSIDEFDFIDPIYRKFVSRENQNELDGIKLLLAMGRNNTDFSESDNVFDAEKCSRDESKQIKGHQSSVPNCDIQHNSADHSNTVSSPSSVNFAKHKSVRQKNCKKRHVEPTNDELPRKKQAKMLSECSSTNICNSSM